MLTNLLCELQAKSLQLKKYRQRYMEKYIGKEAKSSDDLGTYQLPSHHLCVYRKKEAMTVRSLGLLTMRVQQEARKQNPSAADPTLCKKSPDEHHLSKGQFGNSRQPSTGLPSPDGKIHLPHISLGCTPPPLPHPGHCLEDAGSRGAGHCLQHQQ